MMRTYVKRSLAKKQQKREELNSSQIPLKKYTKKHGFSMKKLFKKSRLFHAIFEVIIGTGVTLIAKQKKF